MKGTPLLVHRKCAIRQTIRAVSALLGPEASRNSRRITICFAGTARPPGHFQGVSSRLAAMTQDAWLQCLMDWPARYVASFLEKSGHVGHACSVFAQLASGTHGPSKNPAPDQVLPEGLRQLERTRRVRPETPRGEKGLPTSRGRQTLRSRAKRGQRCLGLTQLGFFACPGVVAALRSA